MDTKCTYADREETLIDYLYDDIDASTRKAFDEHLILCGACRSELEGLGVVRAQLARWAPPEPVGRTLFQQRPQPAATSRRWTTLAAIPAWAQVAAAMLLIGVAAGLANLDVTYNDAGLSVRTGWMARPSAGEGSSGTSTTTSQEALWRADLAALDQQLRTEMRSLQVQQPVAAAPVSGADAEAMLRQVRALLKESEQRQQRELALRIGEVDSNVRAQRIADLRNIESNLHTIQNTTGVDMRRLYRMTNELAVRVSQTR